MVEVVSPADQDPGAEQRGDAIEIAPIHGLPRRSLERLADLGVHVAPISVFTIARCAHDRRHGGQRELPTERVAQNTSAQHYFVPMVHAEGVESLRCDPYVPYCGNVLTRGFSTLVYVTGFRLGLRMPEIHTVLRGLPHVAVPVVVDPRCASPKVHETSL